MHILFVSATRIGDAVLSTGLLSYLVERYPDARFTIAAGPVAAPLFEAVPRLERIIVIDKMDAENVDYPKLLGQIREMWGPACVPLDVPVGVGPDFKGVIDELHVPASHPAALSGHPARR